MEKKKVSGFQMLILVQICVIMIFVKNGFKLQEEKINFQEQREFTSVEAVCVRTRSNGRRVRDYDNTYKYEVNGQSYSVIFYNEWSRGDRGSIRTVYYNPVNPDVCSKFKSISDAQRHYDLWIMVGVFFQCIIVFFAVKSIVGEHNRAKMKQCAGVVLQDDMDYIIKKEPEFIQEERPEEVETIPFLKNDTVDDSFEDTQDNIYVRDYSKQEKKEFTLYTEEEYKEIMKKEK